MWCWLVSLHDIWFNVFWEPSLRRVRRGVMLQVIMGGKVLKKVTTRCVLDLKVVHGYSGCYFEY